MYLLGLDLGTTNLKAVILDLEGNQITAASRRNQPIYPGPAGWVQYDSEALWQDTLALIQQVVSSVTSPAAILALSISSMGETGVPLGINGQAVYPAISWHDLRTRPQAERWADMVGPERTYRITGLPPSTSYGLLKLLWLRAEAPDLFAQCRRWLPLGSYVAYRLCGSQHADYTLAWRTMAFDIHSRTWSAELLAAAAFDRDLWPELCAGGTPLGTIRAEVAALTGLPATCLVVAGGMDAMCAMLAVGAIEPEITLDIIGSSEIILTTTPKPVLSDKCLAASLDVGPHVINGCSVIFGSMTAAGTVTEWFAGLFADLVPEGLDEVLLRLTREAEMLGNTLPPLTALPHFHGSRTPHSNPHARGALLGLSLQTTRSQLFLSLLQSLCFEARRVLEVLETTAGCESTTLRVAGGATQNRLWMSLKANTLDRDLWLWPNSSASAVGAALLAGLGVGVFASAQAAVAQVSSNFHVVRADANRAEQQEQIYHENYLPLYSAINQLKFTQSAANQE